MIVYRLSKTARIKDLSGYGASLTGGRWNEQGIPALYTSECLSLCVCEILVHTNSDDLPVDMSYIVLEIPDKEISDKYINTDYKKAKAPDISGTEWIQSKASLAIRVPSVIIPIENNIILNPLHSGMSEVKIKDIKDFLFDPRF